VNNDLQMRVERTADTVAIYVAGVVDFTTAPLLRHEVDAAFAGNTQRIELHFGKIELMDSSGLSVLIHAHKLAAASTKQLALSGDGDVVRRLLRRTSLDRLIKLAPEEGTEHLAA
jgi:anti-sigma B factor antagonist